MIAWRLADRIGFRRRCVLAAMSIAIIAVNAGLLRAQAAANGTLPSFEVASIKPDNSGWGGVSSTHGLVPHYSVTNIPLKALITRAYEMEGFRISGGPDWINRKRYDIEADIDESLLQQLRKLPEDEQYHQLDLVLQSLLADRFKLEVTHTTKQLPAYDLVVSKGSSKLKAFAVDPFPNDPTGLVFVSIHRDGQSAVELINAKLRLLASGLTTRLAAPVTDQTGVTGNYSFKLRWTDDAQLPEGVVPDPVFDRTLTAALQEQLGLKLVPTKAVRDTIVIDHIEEPTPN